MSNLKIAGSPLSPFTPAVEARPPLASLAWNEPTALVELVERVATLRMTSFFAIQAELLTLHPEECDETDFLSQATAILSRPASEQRQIVNHPMFRIWMSMVLQEMNQRFFERSEDETRLRILLADFSDIVERIRAYAYGGAGPTFHRTEIDPLIAEVLAPSYVPPETADAKKAALEKGHTLGFFKEVVDIARDRITACLPVARELYDALVGMVFYLPDGDFRSCSASRYAGIVLLSARDPSILDLEESIVHETGHQLLYAMAEIGPIVERAEGDEEREYKLPWSTQIREIYGYFHAVFIYVLLARYHELAARREGEEAIRATDRLRHILRGLVAAIPDLDGDPDITERGHAILTQLKVEVAGLVARHPALIA